MDFRISQASHCHDHEPKCEQEPNNDLSADGALRVPDPMYFPGRCPPEAIEARFRFEKSALSYESPDGLYSSDVKDQGDSKTDVEADFHRSNYLPSSG